MKWVKPTYAVLLLLIGLMAIFYVWSVVVCDLGSDRSVPQITEGLGVLIALFASIVALAVADRRKPAVNVEIKPFIDLTTCSDRDGITSHHVVFTMTNKSGFDLRNPVVTFRLPNDRKHPRTDSAEGMTFNSNLFNSRADLRILEFADSSILSNRNLPYWNHEESLAIWIRMRTELHEESEFEVTVSINAEETQGITQVVTIVPRNMLGESARSSDRTR